MIRLTHRVKRQLTTSIGVNAGNIAIWSQDFWQEVTIHIGFTHYSTSEETQLFWMFLPGGHRIF
jgi:hypothetical protein